MIAVWRWVVVGVVAAVAVVAVAIVALAVFSAGNADYWDAWADLSLKDQLYFFAHPIFSVPLVLLLIGVGLGVYYYRRTHR